MSAGTLKTLLLALLDLGRQQEREILETLSEEERSTPGTYERWAPKDIFGHVIAWNDRLVLRVEASARGESLGPRRGDFETVNREIYMANKDRSWEDLTKAHQESGRRLREVLQDLPPEVLRDPDRFEGAGGQPLWRTVAFTAYYHALDHLCEIHIERGEMAQAESLQKRMLQALGTLQEADPWRGTLTYNLACFYARNDRPQAAMALLPDAFTLNPSLVAWSKQDKDLDSLREFPQFQALVAS